LSFEGWQEEEFLSQPAIFRSTGMIIPMEKNSSIRDVFFQQRRGTGEVPVVGVKDGRGVGVSVTPLGVGVGVSVGV